MLNSEIVKLKRRELRGPTYRERLNQETGNGAD